MLTMNPILIAAAVIPAVILLVKVYQADRLEREPPGLLASLIAFGILATFIAMIVELVAEAALSHVLEKDTISYSAIYYFLIVAPAEEGSKYLLVKRRTWKSRYFNCQFDGVVYAVFVSLGFALWENIGYVALNGLGNAILRAVTAVPGHACFGVFMGIYYGEAKRLDLSGDPAASKRMRVIAFLLPAFMHGTYDFLATLSSIWSLWAVLLFIPFIACMFIVSIKKVKRASSKDQFIQQPTNPYTLWMMQMNQDGNPIPQQSVVPPANVNPYSVRVPNPYAQQPVYPQSMPEQQPFSPIALQTYGAPVQNQNEQPYVNIQLPLQDTQPQPEELQPRQEQFYPYDGRPF